MSLAFLLLACGGTPTPPPEPAVDPPPSEAPAAVQEVACAAEDPSAWEGCVGQAVTLEGKVPEVVHAHPILGDPQGYFEVGETQIVVVGLVEEGCTAVSGTLDRVDLGGEPGTRGAYRGWVLRDARCAR